MRRAFTLVEVVVALTMILVVSAVAMGVFLHAQQASVDARVRAQMDRDATLLADALAHDIAFLGAGVALGLDETGATKLVPAIRLGRDDELVFQGDLPYPNAELPGVVTLADMQGAFSTTLSTNTVAVTSETSGSCIPPASAPPASANCDTTKTSLVEASYVAADRCTQAQNEARTCPWALNKWPVRAGVGAVALTLVDSEGLWYPRTNASSPIANAPVNGKSLGVQLNSSVPRKLFDPVGGSFAVTLDRVFWSVEDGAGNPCVPSAPGAAGTCVVMRRQCWGAPTPDDPNYPDPARTAFFGSTSTPVNCDETLADPTGTAWEIVITGVKRVTFRFFDGSATTLATPLSAADKSNVRAVEVQIDFERKLTSAPHTVTATSVRRVFLPNREKA